MKLSEAISIALWASSFRDDQRDGHEADKPQMEIDGQPFTTEIESKARSAFNLITPLMQLRSGIEDAQVRGIVSHELDPDVSEGLKFLIEQIKKQCEQTGLYRASV